MAETQHDLNHPVLHLTEPEKHAYGYLFDQADTDQLGVVTGERAVGFFERTHVAPSVLGEIWQIADAENRGLLTKPGFCMVLRLIGHYQAGREPSLDLASKPAPIPRFEGLQVPGAGAAAAAAAVPSPPGGAAFPAAPLQPQLSGQGGPIRVPPLDPQKALQYASIFDRQGTRHGLLDGGTAKNIFERAGLPNEVLSRIWALVDREQRGALDQTEFIVAMHLLTSMKMRALPALPTVLPPAVFEAAARRGAAPPSRQGSGAGAIPRQFTGSSAGTPARVSSPLARAPGYSSPPPPQPQAVPVPTNLTGGTPWLISPPEKAKYDQLFHSIDTQGRGILSGEQAVRFFSDSHLSEDTLASIWDLADINSEGQLNRDEFAVAMYLIKQQRSSNPPPLPAFLPPALVPPSMRQQPQSTQSTQSTAPAFDNANHTANLPKSAADDLFGLDEPSSPTQPPPAAPASFPPPLQAQTSGASATRDPFGGSAPGSPGSPQRFQPSPQPPPSTAFKPFMPTSAFGASLAQQHTGGSTGSNPRGLPPQHPHAPSHLQQASTTEDLLGDNDTQAEESSRVTHESTELANMSNQIGNLRNQMESTQANKTRAQTDLAATTSQKRDLEQRLQQFRAQYEQEVRTVKELETQLTASRESTKKLSHELALLEGGYQDLQTQHGTIAQQLQADQQENAGLKQRISQINAEVARLKPEIEKLKLDARQQKGLVSINKKQLATSEGERDRLQGEKTDLEKEAAEREAALRSASPPQETSHAGRDAVFGAGVGAAALGGYEAVKHRQPSSGGGTPGTASSNLASPSGASSTNPFFRKTSPEGTQSPSVQSTGSGPTPSAFDALFGPSAAFVPTTQASSRTGTPPATSFSGRGVPPSAGAAAAPPASAMTDSVQSVSSVGEPTPSATPPPSDLVKDSPAATSEGPPPPPPEGRQFTPSQLLPVLGFQNATRAESETSSTRVIPPASRAGGIETPGEPSDSRVASPDPAPPMPGAFDAPAEPTPAQETLPGAFPSEDLPPSTNVEGAEEKSSRARPAAPSSANDDFDSAFAGFGEGEKAAEVPEQKDDPFAPASSSQPRAAGYSSEFPPIQSLEPEDDESSDEDEDDEKGMHPGFEDSFTANSPPRNTAASAAKPPAAASSSSSSSAPASSASSASAPPAAKELAPNVNEATTLGARPPAVSAQSAQSDLPSISQQQSPPSYEESGAATHGGSGERADSNSFPAEFGGLLPSREDPTSPPAPSGDRPEPEQATTEVKEEQTPSNDGSQPSGAEQSLYPAVRTPSTTDVFHDASSRPMSSVTNASPAAAPPTQSKNAFDEFDDFGDLSEAKEADKSGNDFDFGFAGDNAESEFNPAFDSPAASMTNTMTSSQQTPVPPHRGPESNGFTNSAHVQSSNSVQQTPQNAQHDWDAIFSGLDSGKSPDTSLPAGPRDDPWGSALAETNGRLTAERTPTASSPASTSTAKPPAKPPIGQALTPGTEHDDPILKRLTGMGYPRVSALNALEMYDYDINKAVDHLSSGS